MAKRQKYSEEQLLEAVIKFSEVEKKKIKATELARWCRANVKGLEDVRDYHFTRSVRAKDEKTGKTYERAKLSTLKIEEINKSRSLTVSINTNLLLRASNIDIFMEQPDVAKRKMIVETRETVDKLLTCNGNLTRENETLRAENKFMKVDILKITDKIEILQKAQDKFIKQITYLMRSIDEVERKKMLSLMGVEDGGIDLNTYAESLQQNLSEVMNINQSLSKYLYKSDAHIKEQEKSSNILNDIMTGIRF